MYSIGTFTCESCQNVKIEKNMKLRQNINIKSSFKITTFTNDILNTNNVEEFILVMN